MNGLKYIGLSLNEMYALYALFDYALTITLISLIISFVLLSGNALKGLLKYTDRGYFKRLCKGEK